MRNCPLCNTPPVKEYQRKKGENRDRLVMYCPNHEGFTKVRESFRSVEELWKKECKKISHSQTCPCCGSRETYQIDISHINDDPDYRWVCWNCGTRSGDKQGFPPPEEIYELWKKWGENRDKEKAK